jgi:N-acetylglucosaminyl-diphospho-decaprenol L-rhamnosyltransferase
VVNFNTARHLSRCLSSLRGEGLSNIVVVDNGSHDDSKRVAESTGAIWLESGGNIGYGRAANLGAAHPALSSYPLILVCNPDIELRPGALAALRSTLDEHPRVGMVGPKLLNTDGSLYPSARAFPSLLDAVGHATLGLFFPGNPFTRRYRLVDWDHSEAALVDWVSGACFLVSRQAWESVSGFDPAYFMYMEDVDLCWRLGQAGWQVAYEPSSVVVHAQGVAADLHPYKMIVAHHKSMWTFSRRRTRDPTGLGGAVLLAGLAARAALSVAARFVSGARRGWLGEGRSTG